MTTPFIELLVETSPDENWSIYATLYAASGANENGRLIQIDCGEQNDANAA